MGLNILSNPKWLKVVTDSTQSLWVLGSAFDSGAKAVISKMDGEFGIGWMFAFNGNPAEHSLAVLPDASMMVFSLLGADMTLYQVKSRS